MSFRPNNNDNLPILLDNTEDNRLYEEISEFQKDETTVLTPPKNNVNFIIENQANVNLNITTEIENQEKKK